MDPPRPDPSRRGRARGRPATGRPADSPRPPSARTPEVGVLSGAIRRLDAWLAGRRLEDATLAGYLAEDPRAGESPVERIDGGGRGASFRARLAGEQSPAGERTARVLAGYRRTAVGRGRRPGAPLRGEADLAAVLRHLSLGRGAVGRGVESDDVALKRGRLDAVIAGLLCHGGDAAERGERRSSGATSPRATAGDGVAGARRSGAAISNHGRGEAPGRAGS